MPKIRSLCCEKVAISMFVKRRVKVLGKIIEFRFDCVFMFLLATLTFMVPIRAHETFNDNPWNFKVGIETVQANISFSKNTMEEEDSELRFSPNLRSLTYLGVNYKNWLGFSVGLKAGADDQSVQVKGDSSYLDWRFNFVFEQFLLGFHYSRYQGFYLENTEQLDPNFQVGQVHYIYPAMESQTWGFQMSWVWDPETFSLAALMNQTVSQLESGGSFILGGNIGETRIRNEMGLIPYQVRSDFGDRGDIYKGKFIAAQGKAGYGYTWVSPSTRWYWGGYGLMGLGLQRNWIHRLGGLSVSEWNFSARIDFLLSGGYTKGRYYGGVSLFADSDFYFTSGLQISSGRGSGLLFVGYRL